MTSCRRSASLSSRRPYARARNNSNSSIIVAERPLQSGPSRRLSEANVGNSSCFYDITWRNHVTLFTLSVSRNRFESRVQFVVWIINLRGNLFLIVLITFEIITLKHDTETCPVCRENISHFYFRAGADRGGKTATTFVSRPRAPVPRRITTHRILAFSAVGSARREAVSGGKQLYTATIRSASNTLIRSADALHLTHAANRSLAHSHPADELLQSIHVRPHATTDRPLCR